MIAEIIPAKAGPASSATLFFAGWGMDATPFRSSLPAGRDCVVCYDYTDLAFDPEPLRRYDDVLVVAWSMGVWAASRILSRHGLRYSRAVAVNGTMHPINDALGIPAAIFLGTLASLTPASLAKFHRRMCASPDVYAAFSLASPQRAFGDIRDELESIAKAAVSQAPTLHWDLAVVGMADRIFAPANQLRAWEGTEITALRDGHYPALWNSILDGGIAT